MKVVQETGKRKRAVARATLKPGTGLVRINSVPIERYQPEIAQMKLKEVFLIIKDPKLKDVDINVRVYGGGVIGRADAARMAITRIINKYLGKKRVTKAIREYDKSMLSGDKRRIEPKKWGGPKARARVQKSYR
ncbi:MAG: 30S ribosomal protein S9 [Candidatus Lokiarchaeota archaeon]|nr:30S ribosomal protein S9 [Candidatus Lokiarchaeota archaeon]